MNEPQNTSAAVPPQELCALSIGPRQSVRRVRHPQRGEGLAVYRNGPSFFVPDGGAPVAMASIALGGWQAGPPPRTWMAVVDPEHGRVEADLLPRQDTDPPDENHARMWSPLFGAGWLVGEVKGFYRFEPDAGTVVRFEMRGMHVGTPDYAERSSRSRSSKVIPMTDEEVQWTTYRTREAGTLGFRHAPPGEFPRKNDCPAPAKKTKAAKAPAALPGVR